MRIFDMNKFYKVIGVLAVMLPAMQPDVAAEIPQGYYDSLSGLKGAELKTALYNIIKNPSTLGYGTGNNKTWWGFYVTDQLPDGTYRNRYSDLKFPVGSRGTRPQQDNVGTKNSNGNYVEMNIEHSFPSSWFGQDKTSIYNDLFNLYPSDNSTNSAKSNYCMDYVPSPTSDDGYTKLGNGANVGEKAWEPIDEYKGDFSRGYMYMITCWQSKTWTSRATNFLDNNTYPTLKSWAATLYSQWCRKDRVSQVEIDRNNAVYSLQGNRNPFIDFPNLFEYLWGDSTNIAFDPKRTVVADGSYDPGTGGGEGGGDEDDFDPTDPANFNRLPSIVSYNFLSDDCGVTEETKTAPTGKTAVWRRDTKYGWVANGYIDGIRYDCDGTIVTPEIDLSGLDVAFVRFSHAVNFYTSPTDCLTVYIVEDGEFIDINGFVDWPAGNSWAFLTISPIDLHEYVGKKIRFAFRYTSNPTICPAWEVNQLDVRGTKVSSGIDSIVIDGANDGYDSIQPAEYYTVDGRRVDENATGLIVVRQGNRVYKLIR